MKRRAITEDDLLERYAMSEPTKQRVSDEDAKLWAEKGWSLEKAFALDLLDARAEIAALRAAGGANARHRRRIARLQNHDEDKALTELRRKFEAARAEIKELERTLLMCAAHCQGGHSDAGPAAAEVLKVPFPLKIKDLVGRAKNLGHDPADLWPWLSQSRLVEKADG